MAGMTTTDTATDWLGLPCPFTQPTSTAGVGSQPVSLGVLLHGEGDRAAPPALQAWVWAAAGALHVRVRCGAADMARVRALADARTPWSRDAWGDDAVEVQIDAGRTRREYLHVIVSPAGVVTTLRGFNNRQEQGWHPPVEAAVTLHDDAWEVALAVPVRALGSTPTPGDAWGFNLLVVAPELPGGYAQWAPTFGEALNPEQFGTLVFDGPPGDRAAEVAAYARRAAERADFFRQTINTLTPPDARAALGVADWAAWDAHLAARPIRPLRWEGIALGAAGIVAGDRPLAMADADALCAQTAGWSAEDPPREAFFVERLDALGDAWLLTGERKYVDAFERAVAAHAPLLRAMMAEVDAPHQRGGAFAPYHDFQIIRAYQLAYAYLTLREAGLAAETHATVMWTVLRACRFAEFNIRTMYVYGNHQLYESAGLAMTAALFPEFPESDGWARTASEAIRRHLACELYPDGGYSERCTYHTVALGYTMQAVAVIRAAGAAARFPALLCPETLGRLERMHDWLLALLAPDGTHPPFGDFAAHPHLRYFERAAVLFNRPDFAWPLQQLAPSLLAPGMVPRTPDVRSVALPSGFTVLRSGWASDDWYLAAEHGPLGGQHSHVDTMGFAAYAFGRPVALDTGIGTSYEDPRYTGWFRGVRAHNVVAVDEAEPEKVAERLAFGENRVRMRSRAYEHAYGIVHEREIRVLPGRGWLILDRLTARTSLAGRRIDWLLHTPYALAPLAPGVLHAAAGDGGLLVLAGRPETLEAPVITTTPATVPVPAAVALRIVDTVRHYADEIIRDVTMLTWRHRPVAGDTAEFVTALVPYRGERPDVRLVDTSAGWTLQT